MDNIFSSKGSSVIDDRRLPLDNDWVRKSFLVAKEDFGVGSVDGDSVDDYGIKYVYWTRANLKFTDSSLGGNFGINPRPQFTRYSDIRAKGLDTARVKDVTVGTITPFTGMGNFYSEAFDDNAQRIYMRFGVPQFNSLFNFFTTMFNSDLASMANKGRGIDIAGSITKLVVSTVTFLYLPVLTSVYTIGSRIFHYANNKELSSFYSMKPTMPLYWQAVNELVNQMATMRGILPPELASSTDATNPFTGNEITISQKTLRSLHDFMPTVFNTEGGIDVYAMHNRVQMKYNNLKDIFSNNSFSTIPGTISPQTWRELNATNGMTTDEFIKQASGGALNPNDYTIQQFLEAYFASDLGSEQKTDAKGGVEMYFQVDQSKTVTMDNVTDPTSSTATPSQDSATIKAAKEHVATAGDGTSQTVVDNSYFQTDQDTSITKMLDSFKAPGKELLDYFKAEAKSGGGYLCLYVENSGSMSDSFSNEFQDSQLASTINSISSTSRAVSYNVADGNILPGMGAVLSMAQSVATNALDAVHLGGLFNLLFGSYNVDIPKFWSGSSASFSKSNYTMKLLSPYGNAISQMQNLYIPLACLMVGALPLSAGRQTYTSPFLCSIFDRGRTNIPLGMIDSLEIRRGITNQPYNREFRALSLEVSFSVLNLSSIMHVPLSRTSMVSGIVSKMIANSGIPFANALGGVYAASSFDDDGLLFNYLASVTGLSATDALYTVSQNRIDLANSIKQSSFVSSPAMWANRFYGVAQGTFGLDLLTKIYAGVNFNAILATNTGTSAGLAGSVFNPNK